MTAADRQWWLENTAAGQLHRAFGVSDAVDHDAVDARVEEVRKHYARDYGRTLTERELEVVRLGEERRSRGRAQLPVPADVPTLVARVNAANITAGWSYTPVVRQGAGVAMRDPSGQWQGDPAIVAAAEAGEEAKRRQAEQDYESWRSGPLVMRTIAGPS